MPTMPPFTPSTIAALVIAASFAAGLNVYATVLTLGLLAHAHWVVLPPGLEVLADWWVISVSATLFGVEFIADKIPGFDRATTQLSPGLQVLATAVGAAIALAAHGSKTAARALVTPSPEPVSNIALSASEDVGAVGITWLATQHPWAAASITLALLLGSLLMVRWVIKALQGLWQRLRPAAAT
jgi:hypothetical protein